MISTTPKLNAGGVAIGVARGSVVAGTAVSDDARGPTSATGVLAVADEVGVAMDAAGVVQAANTSAARIGTARRVAERMA